MKEAKAGSGGGGPKQLPKPGITLAVCYAIIDMGTQTKSFPGKPPKKQPTVQFCFEIPGQTHVFDEKKGPQCLAMFQEYSYTNTDLSKLPKVLKSWGGLEKKIESLTPAFLKKFLGAPCMLTIEHTVKNAEGKQYANIQGNGLGVTRRMEGLQVPAEYPRNPRIFIDLDAFDWNEFMKLAPFLRDKIKSCDEWPNVLKNFPMPAHLREQSGETAAPKSEHSLGDDNNGPKVTTNSAYDQADEPAF